MTPREIAKKYFENDDKISELRKENEKLIGDFLSIKLPGELRQATMADMYKGQVVYLFFRWGATPFILKEHRLEGFYDFRNCLITDKISDLFVENAVGSLG
jgi:hypothetical protein